MKANVTDKPVRRFVLMYMYKFEECNTIYKI